jgi:hypothetical protein
VTWADGGSLVAGGNRSHFDTDTSGDSPQGGRDRFLAIAFSLVDGRRLERDVTAVLVTFEGRKAPLQVAFGEPGEEAVLGVTALEGRGLMVDPVAKKLIPRDLLAL